MAQKRIEGARCKYKAGWISPGRELYGKISHISPKLSYVALNDEDSGKRRLIRVNKVRLVNFDYSAFPKLKFVDVKRDENGKLASALIQAGYVLGRTKKYFLFMTANGTLHRIHKRLVSD